MWGHLCTELSNLYNFNVGFSTHKSEILIHLSQWQYWWWFWFSFFWTFYFFVLLRVVKHRVFKMNLKINTSFRSRGKWGDYLVTLIPLSWCLNILLNSNFILRMIEWQAEAGSLIIRIHGKQWYWVYKYDLQNVSNIATLPKNIGYSKWTTNMQEGSTLFNKYLDLANIKTALLSQNEYWTDANLRDVNKTSSFTTTTSQQNKVSKDTKVFKINLQKDPSQINLKPYKLNNKTKENIRLKFDKLPSKIQLFNEFFFLNQKSNKNDNFFSLFYNQKEINKNYSLSSYKLTEEAKKNIELKMANVIQNSSFILSENQFGFQKNIWDTFKKPKKTAPKLTLFIGIKPRSFSSYKLTEDVKKNIELTLLKVMEIKSQNVMETGVVFQKPLWELIAKQKKTSQRPWFY